MRPAHAVPTHVGTIEDRLLFGLTVRHLLPLASGVIAAAWLYQHVPLPLLERLPLVALVVLLGVALAALRPGGLPLLTYLSLRLRRALTPRRTVWQRQGMQPQALPIRASRGSSHHVARRRPAGGR